LKCKESKRFIILNKRCFEEEALIYTKIARPSVCGQICDVKKAVKGF
jgi:hypothetical protein